MRLWVPSIKSIGLIVLEKTSQNQGSTQTEGGKDRRTERKEGHTLTGDQGKNRVPSSVPLGGAQ